MKTQIDYSAGHWPNHLLPFEYEFEPDKVLACFLEYSEPDPGVDHSAREAVSARRRRSCCRSHSAFSNSCSDKARFRS